MSDAVEKYLQDKAVSGPKVVQDQTGANSGFETIIGGLLTPFRWGVENITAALIKAQSSNVSWEEAKDIADGDRTGKAWWEEGGNKVTTLGQAAVDYVDSSEVDYTKLQTQQEKFKSGPRKFLSGGIDFLASIFLDPTNFLTAGSGVALKAGIVGGLNKLGRASIDNLVLADSFKNVDEFFTVAQRVAREAPKPENVLLKGTEEYKLGVEQLKPYFKSYSPSFKNIPQITSKGKDDVEIFNEAATYLSLGPMSFAIDNNKLFRLTKNGWEEEDALSKEIFNYLGNKDSSLFANGFVPANPNSFEINVPTESGDFLPSNTLFGFAKDVDGNLVQIAVAPSLSTGDMVSVPPKVYVLNRNKSLDFENYVEPQSVESVAELDNLINKFSEWEAVNDLAQQKQFKPIDQFKGFLSDRSEVLALEDAVKPIKPGSKPRPGQIGPGYRFYQTKNEFDQTVIYAQKGGLIRRGNPIYKEMTETLEDGTSITEKVLTGFKWTTIKKPKIEPKYSVYRFKSSQSYDPDIIYSYDDLERRRSALLREEEALINRESAYQPTYAGLDESFDALRTLGDDILENKAAYQEQLDDLEFSLREFEAQLKSEGLSPKKIKQLVDKRRANETPVYKPVVPDEDGVLAKIEEIRSSQVPEEVAQNIPEDLVARESTDLTEADFIEANAGLRSTIGDNAPMSNSQTWDEIIGGSDSATGFFQFQKSTGTLDEHILDLNWQPIEPAAVEALIDSMQIKYADAFGEFRTAFVPTRFARFIEPNSTTGELRMPKFIEDETGDVYTFNIQGDLVPLDEATKQFDEFILNRKQIEEDMLEATTRYWERALEDAKPKIPSAGDVNVLRAAEFQKIQLELKELRTNPEIVKQYTIGKQVIELLENSALQGEPYQVFRKYMLTRYKQELKVTERIANLKRDERLFSRNLTQDEILSPRQEREMAKNQTSDYITLEAQDLAEKEARDKREGGGRYLDRMYDLWFIDDNKKKIPTEFNFWFVPSVKKNEIGEDVLFIELKMKRTDYDSFGDEAVIVSEPTTHTIGQWQFFKGDNSFNVSQGKSTQGINPFMWDKETKTYRVNPYFVDTIGKEDSFYITAHELTDIGQPRFSSMNNDYPKDYPKEGWFDRIKQQFQQNVQALERHLVSKEYKKDPKFKASIDASLAWAKKKAPFFVNEDAYLEGWFMLEVPRTNYSLYNERMFVGTLEALNKFSNASRVSKRTLLEAGLNEKDIQDVVNIDDFLNVLKQGFDTRKIESKAIEYLDNLAAYRAGESSVAPRVVKKSNRKELNKKETESLLDDTENVDELVDEGATNDNI